MQAEFIFLGELTDLNTYIKAERGNRFHSAKIKKANTQYIRACLMGKKPLPQGQYKINFLWVLPNKKKDPDNIAFAKKFILDGFKEAGIIENDGWNQVSGFTDDFAIDKKPYIKVTFTKND